MMAIYLFTIAIPKYSYRDKQYVYLQYYIKSLKHDCKPASEQFNHRPDIKDGQSRSHLLFSVNNNLLFSLSIDWKERVI